MNALSKNRHESWEFDFGIPLDSEMICCLEANSHNEGLKDLETCSSTLSL